LERTLQRQKTFHYEKPDHFYQLVERASYSPYVDVFARKKKSGWSAWGNEIHEAA
jgi:N6-adenosine-specific RNA methylase IME4